MKSESCLSLSAVAGVAGSSNPLRLNGNRRYMVGFMLLCCDYGCLVSWRWLGFVVLIRLRLWLGESLFGGKRRRADVE